MKTLALLSLMLTSSLAFADTSVRQSFSAADPFEHRFGLGAYATGWHGAYGGAGVGGRLRVELTHWLGTDFFGEALVVATPSGLRHDHPIGFNLYVPFRLSERVRFRPLLGMCVVASFIEPAQQGAPRADDVLVGAHLGAGLELVLHERLTFFTEAQAVAWLGHDRSVRGWTGAVGNEVQPFVVGQVMLGFSTHFGAM